MREDLVYRIYLVRQMLSEALQEPDDALPFKRMRVILTLDHAIEMLLGTALSELGIRVRRDSPLPDLLQQLCQQCPGLASHQTPIQRLRELRNNVQHSGIIPSPEDVRQGKIRAESFIRDTVREVFGQELEAFAPSALIGDEKARLHLQEAERALIESDYEKALTEATISFKIGLLAFYRQTAPYGSWASRISEKLLREIGSAAEKAAQKVRDDQFKRFADHFEQELRSFHLRDTFEEILEPLELARYGIDLRDYTRFVEVTPHAFWLLGEDEPQVIKPPDWRPSQQDALFAVDFACRALLQLQHWLEMTRQEETENHA